MFEILMAFFLGYVLGRVVTVNPLDRKPDKILTWNPDCLGYRPVHPETKLNKSQSYLVCYEVKSNDQER